MKEYLQLLKDTIIEGVYKDNRTGVPTISAFDLGYRVDLTKGYPLLTTKKIAFRSMLRETLWYLSGEPHIRELRNHTKIWDAWADDDGNLESSYGRFWRNFPMFDKPFDKEALASVQGSKAEKTAKYIVKNANGSLGFDQLAFVIDEMLRNPDSRRLVVSAWHPANAHASKLPPCHVLYAINVQGNKLNLYLLQRSGDVAVGIPFNLPAYSALANALAQQTQLMPATRVLSVGRFAHRIIDAHIYAGWPDRAVFYRDDRNLQRLKDEVTKASEPEHYIEIKDWIDTDAPAEMRPGYDHILNVLVQLSRIPGPLPQLEIAKKPLDKIVLEDFKLIGYDPQEALKFEVAE